jgi:predicted RNA methylase
MWREGRRPLPFVPSPRDVVERMLSIADPKPDELLVDLGSGDGRIILSAAKHYRCWSLGVEKNVNLVELTRKKIASMGLDKAIVSRGDLYSYDFSEADVLTLYLLPEVLEILVPKFKKMEKGARIVSHDYIIPGLSPSEIYKVRSVETGRLHRIYLYLVK